MCMVGMPTYMGIGISLFLPTLYPKSVVVESGLIRYVELCTVTRNLFIQSECVFSALDVTKVERAKAGRTNYCR